MSLALRETRKSESVFSLDSAILNRRLSHQQLKNVSLLQAERRSLKRHSLALQERAELMIMEEDVAVSRVQHDQL